MLPRGERRGYLEIHMGDMVISIHAPAKGATECRLGEIERYHYFNPRSREGSDRF